MNQGDALGNTHTHCKGSGQEYFLDGKLQLQEKCAVGERGNSMKLKNMINAFCVLCYGLFYFH